MIGILGGGLTGLTLANLLNEKSVVMEKESEFGGLCKSLQKEGFTFDYGGSHIIFSKDKEALNYLLSLIVNNESKVKRNTKILYKGKYIKYPFENGLSDLPLKENYECLKSYFEMLLHKSTDEVKKPTDFEEWMYFTFGKGITEKYMLPYNRKIWNYDPKLMSIDWIDGRVPEPPLDDIIKSSLGIETEGYTHQLYFSYPIVGGIQSIVKSLEVCNSSEMITGFEVESIKKDTHGNWIVSSKDTAYKFDRLISTIPLQELANALESVPLEIKKAIGDLKYNSLITVMIGVSVPKLNDISWLYIPDSEVSFNRISFPSNYSSKVVPQGKSSVLVEITCFGNDKIWNMNDLQILEQVIKELSDIQVINANTVCFGEVRRFKYAYVIYDLDYQKNMKIITEYFKKLKIDLVGRFSEFKYLNMDACVRNCLDLAENINKGE